MTEKEAEKILMIIDNADGGCPFCVAALRKQFEHAFPEYKYLVDKKRKEEEV